MKLRRRNPDPTKKRTLADRLWRAGDAFVVTAALGGGWWLIANHTPNIAIPADAAPAKAEEGGGYARLVVAGREVVRPLDVDRALADDEAVRAAFPERRDTSLAEREVLVKENGVVLAAVRGALRSPVRPSAPADLLYATGDDDHLNVRLLTRLLRLEAGVHEQNGDHGAAMRANLDAVQLGVAMQNRSPLLPSLVGMVCESVGRRPLWGLTEKLSAG